MDSIKFNLFIRCYISVHFDSILKLEKQVLSVVQSCFLTTKCTLDPVTSIILNKHIHLLDFCEVLDSAGLLQVTEKKDICEHLCDICVGKGVHTLI